MGYNRDSTAAEGKLAYQDIQGLAVANSNHEHDFTRYFISGDNYLHFCFYCDITSIYTSPLPGSVHMDLATGCAHDYKPMVSTLVKHWMKCTKCYKVNEEIHYLGNNCPCGRFYQGTKYTLLSNDTYSVSSRGIVSDTLNIWATYKGKPVSEISASGFANSQNLKGVSFASGTTLTNIGDYAFLNCSSLSGIIVPASAINIGNRAFENCSNLKNVTIPNGVINIGEYAFYNCSSLPNIVIPNSVANIGVNAFLGCTSLYSMAVNPANQHYSSQFGILYNKAKTEFIHIPKRYPDM